MMLDVLPIVSPHAHSTTALHLSAEDRIASLEHELFNLRRAKLPFQPMITTVVARKILLNAAIAAHP
jgi:hypothetical protein